MRIITFAGGEPGKFKTIDGENAVGEIADLLGGEVEFRDMDAPGLKLVVRADGEDERLPIRYALSLPAWLEMAPICGDCAVVRVDKLGKLRDARGEDLLEANLKVGVVKA